MNTKDNGGPAFPSFKTSPSGHVEICPQGGMTLRDWFAGQVLRSACEDNGPSNAAVLSYQYADAMLAERSKP
jgi:hypothetical protein